jgi:hypothetical protein
MPPSADLLAFLEYRLRAVAIGHLALRYAAAWDETPDMEVYFGSKQVMEGKATGFTNGAIESAIIHCRALLEFIGLGSGGNATSLRELKGPRKPDDLGIEQVDGLRTVTINEAMAYYPGSSKEAESALAYVIYLANKGLAHTSTSFTKHDEGTSLLEIAFRGVPAIVINRFYVPLGVQPPAYQIVGRKSAA